MELGLKGRYALITGASKGIGYATAARLASEGVHLHLVARTRTELQSAAQELSSQYSVRADYTADDLSKLSACENLAAVIKDTDILVNNAGAIPLGSIEDLEDKRWRDSWDLKVFGFINLTRIAFRTWKENRRPGVIVNVIGVAGEKLSANYIAGTTGCAALMALTRALGSVSHKHGIRVVGINPGPVLTERLENFLKKHAERTLGSANRVSEVVGAMPFGRIGKPDEIAAAVAFLASDLSAYTTGTILTIDGGEETSWV